MQYDCTIIFFLWVVDRSFTVIFRYKLMLFATKPHVLWLCSVADALKYDAGVFRALYFSCGSKLK